MLAHAEPQVVSIVAERMIGNQSCEMYSGADIKSKRYAAYSGERLNNEQQGEKRGYDNFHSHQPVPSSLPMDHLIYFRARRSDDYDDHSPLSKLVPRQYRQSCRCKLFLW